MRKEYGRINSLSEEFWYHVSQQHELPLAANQTVDQEISTLNSLADSVKTKTVDELADQLASEIIRDPRLVELLRTLISVSDKRLYLDLSYQFSRLPHPKICGTTLCGCAPEALTRHSTSFFLNQIKKSQHRDGNIRAVAQASAEAVAKYFLEKGLAAMLQFYSGLTEKDRDLLVRHLIMPGEIQQAEAKLRGHGIEQSLAMLLKAIGCQMIPEGKSENPMGSHDPNIDPETMQINERDPEKTFSTDLVLLGDDGLPRAFVVGLVHTSDPGQFGVDKSSTVVAIRRQVDAFNASQQQRSVELWGLVDGVGYSENKTGTIDKMMPALHCMVQHHSLYKAALRAHSLGLTEIRGIALDPEFYSTQAMDYMLLNYVPRDVKTIDWSSESADDEVVVMAGRAKLLVSAS
ncbi:hypothetical protein [Laribacter hongkongensis]|uniref:Uncharacterized protein n=1 Tax=Laribacter hongkongensis TaxID=168471 RepID=A0ABD4SPQ8_9NEIS|nr:hypothetical protein [Laribacter hongkongensis]MCG9025462.1 hypothetical protein [Laribacter hongkongensis]